MRDRPSPAILRQLLRYDPETGKLFWLHRDRSFFARDKDWKWWNGRFAGKEAFTARCAGLDYRHGKIFGKLYKAHVVAWAIHYGEWPSDEIDHIHGALAGNVISNLRIATHAENMKNKKVYASNRSGVHGVNWSKSHGKWQVYITIDKKRLHVGYFSDINEAKAARAKAEVGANFGAGHGRLVQ